MKVGDRVVLKTRDARDGMRGVVEKERPLLLQVRCSNGETYMVGRALVVAADDPDGWRAAA